MISRKLNLAKEILAITIFASVILASGCHATTAAVPPPEGFISTSKDLPSIFKNMSLIDSVNGRLPIHLIDIFIPSEEVGLIKNGHKILINRFLSVEESVDSMTFTEKEFEVQAQRIREKGGASLSDAELDSRVALMPELVGPDGHVFKSFSIHKMIPLGLAINQNHAVGTASLLTISVENNTAPFVMVTALVLVRDHVIALKVFAKFDETKDIRWARDMARKWAGEVVAKNSSS